MDSKGGALLGDGRFVLGRQLGKGGMGVVFEAYDRHREERVALKTLSYVDGAAVYRLKREFRTLANVAHTNLVSLYELFADGDQWFFTMELVEGDGFLSHVRPRAEPGEDPPDGRLLGSELNEARLRSSLQQLVEGVLTLHAAGKVHRDIKPSNVLVTPAGRVVILDFGIAGDLRPQPLPTTISSWAPGTAVYMSPEHAAGERTTPASDWYSIGVMLFEALTGKLPYEGSALNVIYRKQQEEPPRVSDLEPRAPPDLASLGDALLARDPPSRPDGASILRHLGLPDPATEAGFATTSEGKIVGRETHLSALESALRATREGRTVTVYVHGPSGMGKSTVVEHFTHDLARRREAVVLTGRCYDRESVPYKALDGVIDSLSQYLRTLAPGELKSLLPHDIHTVGRLFPVLRRVQAIGNEPSDFFDRPEPIELRRRAVAALRELLVRIAARRPLVISVDDLQWTDQDSIALGGDLLRGPGAPDLLLLVSFRSEEIPAKPFLGGFLARADGDSKRELTVGPLTPVQSVTLARSLLERSLPDADQLVPSIVEEAGGSPFLIEQLVRYTNESELPAAAGTTLTEMLDARIRRLPAGARPLLQTLAVAGGPVDFAIAHRAAGLEDRSGDARALVGALRVAHMIRPSGGADLIELYHDRIREALAARVTAEQAAQIHGRLAVALSETAVDDPEALFRHYLAAGESARAGEQAAIAAERAAEALAFDRAVALFERAIEIGARGAEELATWKAGLAEALANAGRPGDAARAYLEAAMHSSSDATAIALRRSAAENFLIGGHNDRGLEVTRGLLGEVGMSMPESPRRVLLSLFLLRARISVRGLGYELTGTDGASKLDLLRMDICWACAIGLTMTDYIVAAYFQARYLLLALDTGEAQRVARALAFEVGFLAARGAPARRRMQAVAEKAESLAEQLGSPREVGMAAVTKGSAYCMLGDFERSAELCEQAERILRERCTGVQWELTTCQIFLLTSLTYLGRTGEVVRRVPLLLESSHKRGNLFEGVELRTRQNLYWLLIDDPEGARRELTGAMSRWTREGFYRQDYNCLLAETQIDLYVGQPLVAWARLEDRWKALRHSQLLRVQLLRCESLHLRGRVALAVAEQGHSREDALRVALQAARKIERERVAWAQPFVSMLRAGVSAVRGDEVSTAPMLAKAIAGFESAGMRLYAAAARRRLGQVLGGDEGQRLREQGDAFMTGESIRSPLHLTAVLAPGFGTQDGSFSRLREPPAPR
jgi:serine/threonine protein kinase/tetratricopeptide (TPR) repeat protein